MAPDLPSEPETGPSTTAPDRIKLRHRPKLNRRQAKFVAHYLQTHNGTTAAKAAGYSRKTARIQASRMLKFPLIQQALQAASSRIQKQIEHVPKVVKEAEVSAARVLSEVAKMANYDHHAISPEQRYRYKLPANELLARHLGLVQAAAIASGPLFAINIHTSPRAVPAVMEVMAEQIEATGGYAAETMESDE